MSTRVDNLTTFVEGIVDFQSAEDEVQPTVASVFGQLVDPIGEQDTDVQRKSETRRTDIQWKSRISSTVGSEAIPVALQRVTGIQ